MSNRVRAFLSRKNHVPYMDAHKGGDDMARRQSCFGTLVDLFLICATDGLWLIWILVRYLRNNS